jgi:uncharacterized cofD-like protein
MGMMRQVRVVALGGGTGLPALLAALKPEPTTPAGETFDLTAIVTVADDGGSSGRIRREMGLLAPGDIRNCLIALSDAPEILRRLFQYRFTQGELEGHSFGNLFIAALAEVSGDFAGAISHLHDILAIRGRIFPSTPDDIHLVAELEDGSVVRGEAAITRSAPPVRRVHLEPSDCRALPAAGEALRNADLVLLGPGSLYTSVLPNLLVAELAEALRSCRGRKVYLCNLTTQPGETDGYRASEHLSALRSHIGPWVCDTVLCNCTPLPPGLQEQYSKEMARPVEVDLPQLHALGVRVVCADLLSPGAYARHDPEKLRIQLVRLARSTVEAA